MAKFEITNDSAIKAVRELIAELKKLKKESSSFGGSSKESFQKAEKGYSSLESSINKLTSAIGTLKKATQQKSAAMSEAEKLTKQLNTAKEQSALLDSKEYKELIRLRKARTDANKAIRDSVSAKNEAKKSTSSLTDITAKLISVYYSLRAVMNIGKQVFSLAKSFDSLNFTMEKVIQNGESVTGTFSFLTSVAKAYGAELVSLTKRYVKFYAAARQSNLSLRETNKIFETFTKVSGVLGLQTDELTGVFLALEQMLSKGKVTTEELRRQLGERLPGAVGIMASALNVTVEELDKMLKKGEVISSEVLPRFADAVEVAYGLESVKKVDTLAAAQNNLTTSWQLFVKAILEGDSVISSSMKGILNSLNQVASFWTKAFSSQESLVDIRVSEGIGVEEESFKKSAFEYVEKFKKGFIDEFNKAGDDIDKAKEEMLRLGVIGGSAEDIAAQESIIESSTKTRLDGIEKVKEAEKVLAKQLKDDSVKKYEADKLDFEQGEKLIKQYEAKSGWSDIITGAERKAYKEALEERDQLTTNLVLSTTRLKNITEILGREESKKEKKKVKDDSTGGAFRERLNNAIKVSEDIIKNDSDTIREQELLAKANAASRVAIAKSFYADILKDENKNADDKLIAKAKLDKAIIDSEIKLSDDLSKVEGNKQKRFTNNLNKQLESNRIAMDKEIALEYEKFNALDKAAKEDKNNQDKLKQNITDITVNYLEEQLEIYRKLGLEGTEAFAKIEVAIGKLKAKTSEDKSITVWIEEQIEGLRVLGDVFTELANLANAFTEQRLQNLEKEQEALDNAHEKDLERLGESTERSIEAVSLTNLSAEEKAERAEGINESAAAQEKRLAADKEKRDADIQRRENEALRRQAVIDKAAALANIAINTAIGISKALAQTGL